MNSTEEQWITTYIYAAAFAIARGVRLVGTTPGYTVTFHLDDSQGQAREALADWFEGSAQVCARTYAAAFREVRHLAYSNRH